jgi:hypothetical protein
MDKEIIKATIAPKQGNKSKAGAPLPSDYSLVDAHRVLDKVDGGTLHVDNVELLLPREHMEYHGNLRVRDEWGTRLKALMDDRSQALKLQLKINNQLLAYKRGTDDFSEETVEVLESMLVAPTKWLRDIDKQVAKHLKESTDPLVKCLLGVPGCGPVTTAYLLVYVDLEKADSPSALWKYVGLHCASGDRYVKGEKGGGNKTLRTVLYNTACSMMKLPGNPYREVYDQTKAKYANSDRIVKSRNTQGHLVEVAWKDAKPSHRHGAALRAIIKHFLADFWLMGRRARCLPERTLYAEQILHHDGIIKPESRGWKLEG